MNISLSLAANMSIIPPALIRRPFSAHILCMILYIARVHNIGESILLLYSLSKMNV